MRAQFLADKFIAYLSKDWFLSVGTCIFDEKKQTIQEVV